MAISYRTRKFVVSLRANTVADIRDLKFDQLPNVGNILAVKAQRPDLGDDSQTFTFTADDKASGEREVDTTIHIGLEDESGNALSLSDLVDRVQAVILLWRNQSADRNGLRVTQTSSDTLRFEQTVGGAVISVAGQAYGTRTDIQAGSDGIANPAINGGAATVEADSSNLGFNPALESNKIQINCNDFQGGGAGTFDVFLRPAGSVRYVEATTGNVAGTDAAVIGGTSLDLLSDGIKLELSGVTAADAEIYITFIKE
jgi:hypothetical protein